MKNYLVYLIIIAAAYLSVQAEVDLSIVWQKKSPVEISFAKWSADGNFIYCAIGNNIHKMDAKTGEFISEFDNTGVTGIYDMDISLMGNYITSHDGGGGIDIWNIKEEKAIKHLTFKTYAGRVGALSVAIEPNEKYLAAYVAEYTNENNFTSFILIYDFISEKELIRIPINNGTIRTIIFSHDGTKFATGSYYKDNFSGKYFNKLCLWETGTWKQIDTIENINTGTSSDGYKLIQISGDDKLIASIGQYPQQIHVYDINTKKLYNSLGGNVDFHYSRIEFLPDNQHYLVYYFSWIDTNDFNLDLYDLNHKIKNYKIRAHMGIVSMNIENDTKIFCIGENNILTMLRVNPTEVINTDISNEEFIIYVINKNIIIESKYISNGYKIIITDLLGKVVYIKTVENLVLGGRYILEVELPSGFYICKVKAGNKEYSQKIEIVR